jgi:hypothetical protein
VRGASCAAVSGVAALYPVRAGPEPRAQPLAWNWTIVVIGCERGAECSPDRASVREPGSGDPD